MDALTRSIDMARTYAESLSELKTARLAAEQRAKQLEDTLRRTQERLTIAEHKADLLQEAVRRAYRHATPGRSPRQPAASSEPSSDDR